MTLYKIRAWVHERKKNGSYTEVEPYSYETVVVENLETAKMIFGKNVAEVKQWSQMSSRYSGKVELFVPHMFPDGTLAYWPEDEKYIDTWEFNM